MSISLLVILIDSIFRTGKNYYPQVLLKEPKYIAKENKATRHITVDLDISYDYSDEENVDAED